MPPPSRITILAQAARILSVDEDILWDMHTGMDEYESAVWIDDGTENGTAGFTEFGLESLTEMLPHYRPAAKN